MKAELNRTFAKLLNPRMSAGLVMLHSLLSPLKGKPLGAGEVREEVDRQMKERKVSKQSITNIARRLEEANIIDREKGYSVNYGYLISMLLQVMMDMSKRMDDLEDEVAKYGPWGRLLLTVPPGLTGLWQVSGRSDTTYQERVDFDLYYINNWNLGLDLLILFRTIPAVLSRKGAY